jgi:hypothetical protein
MPIYNILRSELLNFTYDLTGVQHQSAGMPLWKGKGKVIPGLT